MKVLPSMVRTVLCLKSLHIFIMTSEPSRWPKYLLQLNKNVLGLGTLYAKYCANLQVYRKSGMAFALEKLVV